MEDTEINLGDIVCHKLDKETPMIAVDFKDNRVICEFFRWHDSDSKSLVTEIFYKHSLEIVKKAGTPEKTETNSDNFDEDIPF